MAELIKVEAFIELKDIKEIKYKSKKDGTDRSLFIQHIYVDGPNGGAVKIYLSADRAGDKIVGFDLGVYEKDSSLKLIPIFEVKKEGT
jgi:hypothetical protein